MTSYTDIESPIGPLLVARDGEGICALLLPHGKRAPRPHPDWVRDDTAFDDVRAQLVQYFDGERTSFDVPLHLIGTAFQRRVWEHLLTIPCGETRSYGAVADVVGGSPRAVGTANGQNPIALIVPCHRVIGADGSLTGYGGGLPTKQWLLAHERNQLDLFAG